MSCDAKATIIQKMRSILAVDVLLPGVSFGSKSARASVLSSEFYSLLHGHNVVGSGGGHWVESAWEFELLHLLVPLAAVISCCFTRGDVMSFIITMTG